MIRRYTTTGLELVAVTAAALAVPIDVVAGAAFLVALIWFGRVIE